ncbi:MAG: flavin reductase family protein [Crenarchaeota archaeon]|nr:flavin reductase family protein [Thermoproteota archaeon]
MGKPRSFYYLLHPRPVVLVTSKCPNGRFNVAPIAWITPVSEEPPTLALAVDKENYTYQCLETCPELVINIPSLDMAELVMELGSVSGRNVDKIAKFGVRTARSSKVEPPRIEGCIGWIECKVSQKLDVGEVGLFICEVLEYDTAPNTSTDWGWDLSRTSPLLHVGGRSFAGVGRRIFVRKRA